MKTLIFNMQGIKATKVSEEEGNKYVQYFFVDGQEAITIHEEDDNYKIHAYNVAQLQKKFDGEYYIALEQAKQKEAATNEEAETKEDEKTLGLVDDQE